MRKRPHCFAEAIVTNSRQGDGVSRSRRGLQAILTGVLGMSMAVALSAGAAVGKTVGATCGLPPAATADILYDAEQESARTFFFTYEVEIPAQPAGIGPIDVFIPLAVSDAHLAILRRDVKAS